MTAAFDGYKDAMTRMTEAERQANATVEVIDQELSQLTQGGWRACYLVGLGNVPSSFDMGGRRKPIDVAHLNALWPKLQTAITQYAEAEIQAKQAFSKMSKAERQLLAPPPWVRSW
jgi:hypothetical protein